MRYGNPLFHILLRHFPCNRRSSHGCSVIDSTLFVYGGEVGLVLSLHTPTLTSASPKTPFGPRPHSPLGHSAGSCSHTLRVDRLCPRYDHREVDSRCDRRRSTTAATCGTHAMHYRLQAGTLHFWRAPR